MKTILGLMFLFTMSSQLRAEIFVEVDGRRYECDREGGSGGTDQNCISNVSSYCYNNTSNGRDVCFNKASQACRNARSGFSACVSDTASYCYNNTSNGRDQCFELALNSCSGSFLHQRMLMESVKDGALLKAKGLQLKDLK